MQIFYLSVKKALNGIYILYIVKKREFKRQFMSRLFRFSETFQKKKGKGLSHLSCVQILLHGKICGRL